MNSRNPLAEKMIRSIKGEYYRLRKAHPGNDEHWYLANTWLKRYGSTEQSIQKGKQLTEFIAYNDSHLFSVLEPPDSINGFALFLVYRELGIDIANIYYNEYSRIIEPVRKLVESKRFADKHKVMNPNMWRDNQEETESSYTLYWLLKGMEFNVESSEEFEEDWKDFCDKHWIDGYGNIH